MLLRFYRPLCETDGLRGRNRFVLRFYRHSLFGTTSGGHIFLCVKKDMEERHAKGLQSRPLESCFYTGVWRGDVRRYYVCARVQLTRFRPVRGVLRTASTDSCLLHVVRRKRWHLKNNRRFANSAVGWLRFCIRLLRNSKTFPRGDGLGRHYVDDTTITTALRWLQQFPIFHRHCEPVTDVTGVAIRIPLWYALRWSHNV